MNSIKNIINILKNNKIANNFIILLSGEGIVSIINMLSMAIILNTIGLDGNGMIISVQTYCTLMNSIFGFKSFQALIKYINESIHRNDRQAIKEYIYQSYFLDILAVMISVFFSFIFLNSYSSVMGWTNELKKYSYIYILGMLFQIQGTPIGILRTYNKFNYITYNNIIVSIFKMSFYIIGYFMGCKLGYFIIIEILAYILPNVILNIFCFKLLYRENLIDFYRMKFKLDKNFLKFNIYSNLSSTIDIPVGELTTVIINKYLGFYDISVYKIFEKIGGMIGKLGAPLGQIIYPEMNLYIAKKQYKKAIDLNNKLIKGIFLLGVSMVLGVVITYKLWLGIFIKNYSDYIISLIMYLLFIVFVNATTSIHSLFMALNYIRYNVPILLVINTFYLLILFYFVRNFGINGVILALFLQSIFVVIFKMFILKKNNYKECN